MFLPDRLKKLQILGNQKGSITIMVGFLMPVMLLMIMMIVNINHLVFTKIKLQNTVDACALSAAAVQAAGLNEIADLNRELVSENKNIRGYLRSGTWYKRSYAKEALDFFYNKRTGVIDYIRKYQNNTNSEFAKKAEIVAEDVRYRNLPASIFIRHTYPHNTRQLTTLREQKNTIRYRYYTRSFSKGTPRRTVIWRKPDNHPDRADRRDHDGRHWVWRKRTGKRLSPLIRIPEKVVKTSPTYVYYELWLPPRPFPVGSAIFGDMPHNLRARAAARPGGGHISHGIPEYEAVLEK